VRPDGTLPDGATGTCAPQPGTLFSPTWHAPIQRGGTVGGACTAQQVNDYFTACFGTAGSTSCQSYTTANASCASCLSTPPTASQWGALIAHTNWSEVNMSGCLYATGATSCAAAVQASAQCQLAWCEANCPVTDQTTLSALDACESEVNNNPSECESYATRAQCADDAGTATTDCVGTSFQDTFTRIATILCVSGP
jgi:hypothetical protein